MLMLKGRAKAILHSLRHFGNPKHRIWRVMLPVTFWRDLLSGGTAADIAIMCECGEVFEQHMKTGVEYTAVNDDSITTAS